MSFCAGRVLFRSSVPCKESLPDFEYTIVERWESASSVTCNSRSMVFSMIFCMALTCVEHVCRVHNEWFYVGSGLLSIWSLVLVEKNRHVS